MAEDVKFDEEGLLRKIRFGADFGSIKMESAFEALQLFYVAQSPSCPEENKPYIADFIEELTRLLPFFITPGFFAGQAIGSRRAAAYDWTQSHITEEIKAKAKEKIRDIYGGEAAEKL